MHISPTKNLVVATIALFAMGQGCGDDEPKALKVVTYNAGLADGFVDHARDRAAPALDAISKLDADVVCAQEVWDRGRLETLLAAPSFSQHFNRPAEPDENDPNAVAACSHGGLADLRACVIEHCQSAGEDGLAGCVLSNCQTAYAAVEPSCQQCLVSALGQPFEAIEAKCTTSGGVWAYGGSYGTAILSKRPLRQTESLRLDSHFNRRSVLYAMLDDSPVGKAHVFCTHLSPVFGADVPYPEETGSWIEEQAQQIDALIGFVTQKAQDGAPVILLGDLNTGPAVGSLQAEAPQNFQRLVDAGFVAPYLQGSSPLCTFCSGNPLTRNQAPPGVVIDHVLLRDFTGKTKAERILDESLILRVDGQDISTAYSDHYGVRGSLTRR